jgi:hypothetical protein
VKRREFITLLACAAAAWPLAARAQQRETMRRIGVLMNFAAEDPAGQSRLTAFLQGLGQLGCTTRVDQCYKPCTARCAAKYACERRNAGPNCFTNFNKCGSFCWRIF